MILCFNNVLILAVKQLVQKLRKITNFAKCGITKCSSQTFFHILWRQVSLGHDLAGLNCVSSSISSSHCPNSTFFSHPKTLKRLLGAVIEDFRTSETHLGQWLCPETPQIPSQSWHAVQWRCSDSCVPSIRLGSVCWAAFQEAQQSPGCPEHTGFYCACTA